MSALFKHTNKTVVRNAICSAYDYSLPRFEVACGKNFNAVAIDASQYDAALMDGISIEHVNTGLASPARRLDGGERQQGGLAFVPDANRSNRARAQPSVGVRVIARIVQGDLDQECARGWIGGRRDLSDDADELFPPKSFHENIQAVVR